MTARLEHINISVPDAKATARVLCNLFDWTVRWQGAAMNDGYSVHVGDDLHYVALYSPGHAMQDAAPRYRQYGGLNHIGLEVDDLEVMETRVKAAGYAITQHADYEPGRRFYFDGPDGVEYELVCYDT